MTAVQLTSLGVACQQTGPNEALIDLSGVRVFTGLSVIARMLGDEIIEQIQAADSDVVVQRRVIAEITPELAAIGLSRVLIYARTPTLGNLKNFQEDFHYQMRTVFGTLQRPRWGGVLFPELFPEEVAPAEPTALLFPFHLHSELEDIDYFFLVERNAALRFLRITIEPVNQTRLDLQRIAHVIVDDLERRTYIQGLTRAAESFRLGLLRECEERRTEHAESDRRHPEFFAQLRDAGLADCDTIAFQWPARVSAIITGLPRPNALDFLKRVLLTLEDRDLTRQLNEGLTLEVRTNDARAFLDVSRLGRTLNIAFGEPRRHADLQAYLDRMPLLRSLSRARPGAFAGADIFLIHHITGEILAVIKALEAMGAARITVLFVRYAGVAPAEYLEALLSLPRSRFEFFSLQRVESDVRGHYVLSDLLSPLEDLQDLSSALRERRLDFFDAMRLAAGRLFLRSAVAAKNEKRRIVLLEDGGYLGPELQRYCAEDAQLADVAAAYGAPLAPSKEAFSDWLLRFFPGSVEHTRNGYDRLLQTAASAPALKFPSLSIAVSKLKRGDEAGEVAVTVMHAIESVLHGLGLVLSRRSLLVLGCCGAIGSRLMTQLAGRGHAPWGVDLAAPEGELAPFQTRIVRTPEELPQDTLLDIDLIVGVIGTSILNAKFFEAWLAGTRRPALFLASGSTKTLEFAQLSRWLQDLEAGKARLGGETVRLTRTAIRDPQSRLILGARVLIESETRTYPALYLLADLTPINFLFYGVPTETMDAILTQLVQLGAAVAGEARLAPGVYALDQEIDADGRLLQSAPE